MTTPITSPRGGNQASTLLPVNQFNFPDGPVVRFVLYHLLLFKVEHDFPNVICIQDVPCNCFFSVNATGDLGASIHPVPDFVSGWQELILVPIIRKSLYKIFMVLQVPNPDEKIAMIIGVMGQGATFCNQDLVLLCNDFHCSWQYYCAMRFKKTLAMMNFSTKNDATLNIYIHLENEAYTIFDGILMNLHILPYTAHTNSALTKAVDQLIQQTVFSPIVNTTSTVPSSALSILSSGSHNVAPVDPLGQTTCTIVGSNLMTLFSPAADVNDNLTTTTHANVDHVTLQVTSQPQVSS